MYVRRKVKRALDAVKHEREFDAALKGFLSANGLEFNDRALLRSAFTHPSFSAGVVGRVAHQKKLERDGDDLLEKKVAEFLETVPHTMHTNRLQGFLNGNLFFSKIALAMGIEKTVRRGKFDRNQPVRRAHIMTLASTFEAFVMAYARDQGNIDQLLERHLFGFLFESRYDRLFSKDWRDVAETFSMLIGEPEAITVRESGKDFWSHLVVGGRTYSVWRNSASEALYDAIMLCFNRNPWLLWQLPGNSITYPLMSDFPFGQTDSGAEIPADPDEKPVEYVEYAPREVFRIEDTWPILEIEYHPMSWIGKLQSKIAPEPLVVRTDNVRGKDALLRYAFYAEEKHLATIRSQKPATAARDVLQLLARNEES